MKIAFVGVAHPHADDYAASIRSLPSVQTKAVYDSDPKLGRGFARKWGARYYDDYDGPLRDDSLDAVLVASETSRHYELMVKAAEKGKHVLCEKPLALTLRQTDEMNRAAKRSGVKFQMCHVMRHHPTAILARGLVKDGRFGKLRGIVGKNRLNVSAVLDRTWFTDPKLSGGGAVMDHTVHLADLMRWYTESEAVEVYTQIGKHLISGSKVEDNFLTTVTFSNGVVGHIDGSWSYSAGFYTWGDVSLEVLGSRGAIFLDAFNQNISSFGMTPPSDKHSWHYYGTDANAEMIRNFADSVQNGAVPRTTWLDGRKALEITLASYESARKGKPIALS